MQQRLTKYVATQKELNVKVSHDTAGCGSGAAEAA